MKNKIIEINITRYVKKSKRYKLGLIDTDVGKRNDMISNFIEHCYRNIDLLYQYEYIINNLNNAINGHYK